MQRKGFTLIELLVVVVIIGVLTAIAMPQYRRSLDRAKTAEAKQMLPALYEARERWAVEHECMWSGASEGLYCADGEKITVGKLDIEMSAVKSVANDGQSFSTDNFTYYLKSAEFNTLSGSNQRCVYAQPRWGAGRGLTAATIYYRGAEFACRDNEARTHTGACEILDVDDGAGTYWCPDL